MRVGAETRNARRGKTTEYEMTLHIALLAVLTLAVGYLMAVAGIQKSALEWRRRRRTCPSCGRGGSPGRCPGGQAAASPSSQQELIPLIYRRAYFMHRATPQ